MRLLGVVLACAVVFGACADDDSSDVGGSDGTTTTSEATTSTTSAPRPGCTDVTEESQGTWVDGPVGLDADGDGVDDEAELFLLDEGAIELQVAYGAGGRSVTRFDESIDTLGALRVERVADIEGDGDDDVWLVVGSGASTEIVSLVLADGCDVVRPFAEESRNVFPVGASVGFLSGVECVDVDDNGSLDGFLAHSGTRTDGAVYEGTSVWWAPDAGTQPPRLERLESYPFTVDLDAEEGSQYVALTCP